MFYIQGISTCVEPSGFNLYVCKHVPVYYWYSADHLTQTNIAD